MSVSAQTENVKNVSGGKILLNISVCIHAKFLAHRQIVLLTDALKCHV
jgi:hypothetical protein